MRCSPLNYMIYSWVSSLLIDSFSEVNRMSQCTFLTSSPWPLTYDLELQTWPRCSSTWPPCKIKVCISVHSAGIARGQMDRQTAKRCQNTWCVNIKKCLVKIGYQALWPFYTRTYHDILICSNNLLRFHINISL